jgi:hypothetical protein
MGCSLTRSFSSLPDAASEMLLLLLPIPAVPLMLLPLLLPPPAMLEMPPAAPRSSPV